MKEKFEAYLVSKGYSVETPTGKPSTVHDYCGRIEKICKDRNITWDKLAENIVSIAAEYDVGGVKQDVGAQSHNAVRNALLRFKEFVESIS